MDYIVSNASSFIQAAFYISLVIYVTTLIWPEKRTTINEYYKEGMTALTKEEKRFIKFISYKWVKLFMPKENSKSYINTKKMFDKMGSFGKYKSLDLFFAKKTYNAAITLLGIVSILLFPGVLFQIQIRMGIENPSMIVFPPAFLIMAFLTPVLVYTYPNFELKSISVKKELKLKKELISLGVMIHTMLETGNNVYDILGMVKDIKPVYKEYINIAMNEYFISHRGAIETLKEKINISEFDMIGDALIYADETDNNYAAKFLGEYLDRLETTSKISDEKGNKIKPYLLLLSAMPPLIAALIIWFYPWIVQATDSLTKGINGF